MKFETNKIKNIAIIAHVDHGKTTLVDKMLQQSGTFKKHEELKERVLDSNDLEKERGITILSKNTGIIWNEFRINIIDTPGHADFGGEVERILSMADSVLLLVDAVEGPMPQTTFVLKKALESSLKPIVVINKIDRDGARPDWVLDKTFDLFVELNANEKQLDFPIIYASALNGWATKEHNKKTDNLNDLFSIIIDNVESPDDKSNEPLQMQITALDYSNFLGIIGIGKVKKGLIKKNQTVSIIGKDEKVKQDKVSKIMIFQGLHQKEVDEAFCGDIVALSGLDDLKISDTICDPEHLEKMPNLKIDEPTLSMIFQVNDSPFAGNDGKFVTSRVIKDRLDKEIQTNVALKVESTESADKFKVSGRGELHLSILIENMRRDGFELGVSKPEVIQKEVNGEIHEPFEQIVIDLEEEHQGSIMEEMGLRKAELKNMQPDGKGRIKLEFIAPSRGMIGFRSHFLTLTSGSGILTSVFDHYGPAKKGEVTNRQNGVLVSMTNGKTLSYSLFNLQNRGKLFVGHGLDIYKGQIVGLHSRDNDLPVNPTKAKQLTNVRASGTDENLVLTPHIEHTLEQALEFIEEDELVEVTPKAIRLRKKAFTF